MMLRGSILRTIKGITLIEIVIVLTIIGVLSAMALPPYLQWRRDLEARETAKDFINILRRAKSEALRSNLEQEVQFNSALRRYGSRQGNQAYNTIWGGVGPITNWVTIKPDVSFIPSINIQFNPNGTSTNSSIFTSATLTVRNIAGTRQFVITVANTGTISLR
jgi:prepilin-type N-terminal cleavage/methylation domain-containing protein